MQEENGESVLELVHSSLEILVDGILFPASQKQNKPKKNRNVSLETSLIFSPSSPFFFVFFFLVDVL